MEKEGRRSGRGKQGRKEERRKKGEVVKKKSGGKGRRKSFYRDAEMEKKGKESRMGG